MTGRSVAVNISRSSKLRIPQEEKRKKKIAADQHFCWYWFQWNCWNNSHRRMKIPWKKCFPYISFFLQQPTCFSASSVCSACCRVHGPPGNTWASVIPFPSVPWEGGSRPCFTHSFCYEISIRSLVAESYWEYRGNYPKIFGDEYELVYQCS